MRIAVTGSSGFVGARLVRRLAADGHTVHAFGRRRHAPVDTLPGVIYRVWDLTAGVLTDPPAVDAVVHSAARVSDWGPAAAFEAVNVGGTRAVLATFPRARLVHVSSASVYDPLVAHDHAREDEAPVGRYLNAYGATKAAAERVVAAVAPDAVVLRPQIVYGPGDTTVVPRLLAARRGGALVAVGDGRNRLSVTHVDTLVDAVVAALERGRGVYNVADAEAHRVDDLLRRLLEVAGLPSRVRYVPAPLADALARLLEPAWHLAGRRDPPPVTRYVVARMARENTLDTSRAARDLGLAPRRAFPDGVTVVRS